jgi:hypothetical protein
MRVPDPMSHDFGLGSDFSEASTPGGRAVRRAEEPSETFGCPANWTAERCFLRRCYRNPDPGNNRLSNLRWAPRGTSKQGRTLGPGLPPTRYGSDRPNAVLTEADIPDIRAQYRAGFRYHELAEEYGVDPETVRNVLVGNTWSHIPDPLGPIVMRRGPDSESSSNTKLDWDAVRAIRAGHAAGRSYARLAAEHGVSKCTVRDIVKGRTWREDR